MFIHVFRNELTSRNRRRPVKRLPLEAHPYDSGLFRTLEPSAAAAILRREDRAIRRLAAGLGNALNADGFIEGGGVFGTDPVTAFGVGVRVSGDCIVATITSPPGRLATTILLPAPGVSKMGFFLAAMTCPLVEPVCRDFAAETLIMRSLPDDGPIVLRFRHGATSDIHPGSLDHCERRLIRAIVRWCLQRQAAERKPERRARVQAVNVGAV